MVKVFLARMLAALAWRGVGSARAGRGGRVGEPARERGPDTGERAMLALTALLVVSLGCALLAGAGWFRAQRMADRLGNLVPFAPTTVIRTDRPTVVRQVQGLAKLETSRYTLEKILTGERSRQGLPAFLAGEKLVLVAHGEVVAGLDLAKVTEADVDVSGEAITLRLPPAEILYTRIDNEKSSVYERETGVFSRPDKDLESQVRAEAEGEIRDAAIEDGILREATENGRQSLRALLTSMGYEDVRFEEGGDGT